uniref:B30.2/SPRY domain-containing protein n=1 Tax=Panagrellus redivivus TaxID=6233 RepID=A0A7E4W5N9_PANRE
MDDIPMADSSDTDNERDLFFGGNEVGIAQLMRNRAGVRHGEHVDVNPVMLPAVPVVLDAGSSGDDKPPARPVRARSNRGVKLLPGESHIHPRIAALYPGIDLATTKIPTQWSTIERHHFIYVGPDKLVVRFKKGPMQQQDNASAIRANCAIPHGCGLYYFEITILPHQVDNGTNLPMNPTRCLGIGIMEKSIELARLPGWDPNSYGYHGDDGNFFSASGKGRPYGPKFGVDDTIGCGVNFVTRQVFFTKNGTNLGYLDIEEVSLQYDYYPVVGMQAAEAVVRTNFGQRPFRYDIENDMRAARNAARESFRKFELPPEKVIWMNEAVSDWLIYAGYGDSAKSFAKTANIPLKVPVAKIKARNGLVKALKEGQTEEVISWVEKDYPEMANSKKELMVMLYLQDFIEESVRVAKQIQCTDGLLPGTPTSSFYDNHSFQSADEPSSSSASRFHSRAQRRRGAKKRRNSPTTPDSPRRTRNGNSVEVSNGNGVASQRNGHTPGPSNGTTTIIAEDVSSSTSNNVPDDAEMIDLSLDSSPRPHGLLSPETINEFRIYESVIEKARAAMSIFRDLPKVSVELHDLLYRCFDMMTCPATSIFSEFADLCSQEHRNLVAAVLGRCILEHDLQETLPPKAPICRLIDTLESLKADASRFSAGGKLFTDSETTVFSNSALIPEKVETPISDSSSDSDGHLTSSSPLLATPERNINSEN